MRTLKSRCFRISFFFIWIWLLTVVVNGAEILPLQPSDKMMVYDESAMPEIAWMFAHMDADGFQVPADGDSFAFNDYLDPVPDKVPKVHDLCFYTEKGKPGFGIVQDINADKESVILISPMGHGLIVIQSIELTDVRGFMRPSKPVKEHGKGEHI